MKRKRWTSILIGVLLVLSGVSSLWILPSFPPVYAAARWFSGTTTESLDVCLPSANSDPFGCLLTHRFAPNGLRGVQEGPFGLTAHPAGSPPAGGYWIYNFTGTPNPGVYLKFATGAPVGPIGTGGTPSSYLSDVTPNQGLARTGVAQGGTVGLIDCDPLQMLQRNAADTAWQCVNPPSGTGAVDVSVLVRTTSNTSVANATDFVIPWPTPVYQAGGTWWTSANPTRLTPPVAGKYAKVCGGQFLSNATGMRQITLKENGLFTGPRFNITAVGGGTNTKIQTMDQDIYAVGDYIESSVWQNSGGSLNLGSGPDTFCAIWKTN
jgi:hypothetical protein